MTTIHKMEATPRKEILQPCFICAENNRFFAVHGKKATEDQLIDKLNTISGKKFDQFFAQHSSKRFGICRTCYARVNTTYAFHLQLVKVFENADQSEQTRFKRLAISPITPKIKPVTVKDSNSSKVHVKRSRRPLNLEVEIVVSDPSGANTASRLPSDDHCYTASVLPSQETTEGSSSVNFEHSYSKITVDSKEERPSLSKETTVKSLKGHLALESDNTSSLINEIVDVIISHQVLLKAVERKILSVIRDMCTTLASRNVAFSSVLSRYRSISSLLMYGDQLLNDIIHEISQRIPFLLDVFTTIVTSTGEPTEQKIAPIAAAYAILMNARSEKLSAWHRLTTIIATRGHLDDSAFTTLNHLGVCMSATTKLRLLDEAGNGMDVGIVSELKKNPIVKVTGDNLDIFVKTGHKSLEKQHKDLHLFASNIIFSRIARPHLYSLAANSIPLEKLKSDLFLPHGHYIDTLMNSYIVLLGRMLSELKPFTWMKSVLPAHINHPYQQQMAVKSKVYQLPIMFKNEAKHEDCVDILDGYENILEDCFVKAFGSNSLLRKYQIVVGGDQLTRVRLEEAKQLRSLATTPQKRFEDINPFVIELWHTKQDFLEKAYKELYSTKSIHQSGTLYHFRAKLQRTDINGKVKGAFKQHHDFIVLVGKQMVTEQFLEYFGMEDSSSYPTANIPAAHIEKKSIPERLSEMNNILRQFILHHGYLEMLEGTCLCSDKLYCYCNNLCRWFLQLVQMEDIAKEGDIIRLIPSLMVCIPFFYSHSRLSKYFVEVIDFIMKSEYLLSPLQRVRVLEGAFTNLRGGIGNNIETDLVQENSVRNQKDLIRGLGANKTEKAISRCTKAADTVSEICDKVDSAVSVKKKATRHHTPKAEKDEKEISKTLRSVRPFRKVENRKCEGFPNIHSSPLHKIDRADFKCRMNQVIQRLYWGQNVGGGENDYSDSDVSE